MVKGLSLSISGTPRRLLRTRIFSASSRACISSKTRHASTSLDPKVPVEYESGLSTKQPESLRDPTIPEIPESKLRYQQNRPTSSRRPGVKPPPTLALPSSMLPPPPRIPIPTSLKGNASSEISGNHEKTFNIYMDSLNKHDDEPTLDDFDALRPLPSTILAALDGVIGSGRALLAKDHPLHLAIEQLGAQEASVGGGPKAKRTVTAGSRKAKRLEYQALYAATEAMITRGFTVAQLRGFEKETKIQKRFKKIDLPSGKSTSKPRLIHSLMNLRWGMIHPTVVEKYMDGENKSIEQSYLVSPSELFIFLGRDGEDLIHLSKKLEMRINVDRQSDSPEDPGLPSQFKRSATRPGFIIRASGVKSSHEKLRKYIENQRDTMTVRVVSLPIGPSLSPSLLQSISRIAGAFVENTDPKFASLNDDENSVASVSITAHSPRSAYTAERLVRRAAVEAAHRSKLSLFVLKNEEPSVVALPETEYDSESQVNQYALYPFSNQGFRIRRVQMALASHLPSNDIAMLPLTAGNMDVQNYDKDEAFILTGEEHSETEPHVDSTTTGQSTEDIVVRNLRGEPIDPNELIFGEADGKGERIVNVTFGHIVFKTGKATTLDSPLSNPATGESILEWVNRSDSGSRAFIPGQVPSMDIPIDVTPVHRLQYRTIEGEHVINVNVQLPRDEVEQVGNAELSKDNTSARALEFSAEAQSSTENTDDNHPISPHPESNSMPAELQSEGSVSSESLVNHAGSATGEHLSKEENLETGEIRPLPVEITVGTQSAFELMLPESTMDLYVQVANTTRVVKPMIPEVLDIYLDGLSKFFTTDIEMPQPDPPQHLDFDGKHYVLVKNTSAHCGGSTSVDLPGGFTVATELSLDLESNTRTAFTEACCSILLLKASSNAAFSLLIAVKEVCVSKRKESAVASTDFNIANGPYMNQLCLAVEARNDIGWPHNPVLQLRLGNWNRVWSKCASGSLHRHKPNIPLDQSRNNINSPRVAASLPYVSLIPANPILRVLMAPPGSSLAPRSKSKKSRCGFSRGLKRLLTNLALSRSKSHSRPNTLTLFDIVTNSTKNYTVLRKHASCISIHYEDSAIGSSTPSLSTAANPRIAKHSNKAHRAPRMADRVVDVRLESVYDDGETHGGYFFASALQDAWHAQDIENLSTRS
ncbi:unnamed protein product [Rhizoctonia solani]|uniref:Uncharacterized protein n=1 Tax=Rhizoctonia solani TaxID=456999 RepID=A0A8H3A4Q4_9AGAM|nr:unnamed protein product [Rhizoctonia solani]